MTAGVPSDPDTDPSTLSSLAAADAAGLGVVDEKAGAILDRAREELPRALDRGRARAEADWIAELEDALRADTRDDGNRGR